MKDYSCECGLWGKIIQSYFQYTDLGMQGGRETAEFFNEYTSGLVKNPEHSNPEIRIPQTQYELQSLLEKKINACERCSSYYQSLKDQIKEAV